VRGNVADLVKRKHETQPDIEIEAWITGVRCPGRQMDWNVTVSGEDDPAEAAGILERAAEVLRMEDEE